ncbi:hypothetical protein BDM02DRAFT_3122048 [Thelephora ganbajun]|uniref:Uncharacterized protein n=1 Tax=Thelephora ganbajun TaxID=370292 RepID=A0ACB6Z461_THEGA|nr:hypothetical protein BDM02DRAFT_3122048 [Thelephora ganbajun]
MITSVTGNGESDLTRFSARLVLNSHAIYDTGEAHAGTMEDSSPPTPPVEPPPKEKSPLDVLQPSPKETTPRQTSQPPVGEGTSSRLAISKVYHTLSRSAEDVVTSVTENGEVHTSTLGNSSPPTPPVEPPLEGKDPREVSQSSPEETTPRQTLQPSTGEDAVILSQSVTETFPQLSQPPGGGIVPRFEENTPRTNRRGFKQTFKQAFQKIRRLTKYTLCR